MVGHREHSRNGYDRAVTTVGTRALELVTRAGVAHRVHAYASPERHGRERDERPTYGADAASALGVEPARIFKTLAAMVDERLVLAVVPVDRELDPKRLADACRGRRAALAEPSVAERATAMSSAGSARLARGGRCRS
jgi:Cys-tRNA(Pro)/Cys-tRNA(Cys) deacylase